MSTFGSSDPGVNQLDIERQVRRLRSKSPLGSDDVIATAQRIHDWLHPRGSFVDSLPLFGAAMEGVACAAMQDERLTVAANGVSTGLTWLYAQSLPYEPNALEILRERADQFVHAASLPYDVATRKTYARAAEHLTRLNGAYYRRLAMVNAVQERIPHDLEWNILDATELDQYAAYVAYQIAECRRYGVKPCVMQDGILHRAEDTWVFLDGFDELGKLPSEFQEGLRPPLAITHLADQRSVKSLETREGQYGHMRAVSSPYDRYMSVSVRSDGSLTIDSELGLYTLERIFEEAGRSEIFGIFRLIHLMRLSDLIVPEIVRRRYEAPDWPTPPPNRSAHRRYVNTLPGQLRQLIIPRVRLLEDVDTIRQAQDGELAEDIELTEQLQQNVGRVLGPMVGHFRRLPAGHSASPDACVMALRERGMLPPEGMTYVKRRDGETVIHVARRR